MCCCCCFFSPLSLRQSKWRTVWAAVAFKEQVLRLMELKRHDQMFFFNLIHAAAAAGVNEKWHHNNSKPLCMVLCSMFFFFFICILQMIEDSSVLNAVRLWALLCTVCAKLYLNHGEIIWDNVSLLTPTSPFFSHPSMGLFVSFWMLV